MNNEQLLVILERIASALEKLAPPQPPAEALEQAEAFVWDGQSKCLLPVTTLKAKPLALLIDFNNVVEPLLKNTERFARGLVANNALLWGARGMGKSSFVKAVVKEVSKRYPQSLALIEISAQDLNSLAVLLAQLRDSKRRFILFCDDLSFNQDDSAYKALKMLLEGSIVGKPDNVVVYATSNRRNLLPQLAIDNELATTLNGHEAIEEKVSLADRFGLWLGVYHCTEGDYLAMVRHYSEAYELEIDQESLYKEAKQWALKRGGHSGRVAWQYVIDLAGRCEKPL